MQIFNLTVSFFFLVLIAGHSPTISQSNRWNIKNEEAVTWDVSTDRNLPHKDHIEMSGKFISAIIRYEVDAAKNIKLSRNIIWPSLRTIPKETDPEGSEYRAYLKHTFADEMLPTFTINDSTFKPSQISNIELNGFMIITYATGKSGLQIKRTLFPSMDQPALVEKWEMLNNSSENLNISIDIQESEHQKTGVYGTYKIKAFSTPLRNFNIPKKARKSFALYFSAERKGLTIKNINFENEEQKRKNFIKEVDQALVLRTPDKAYNTLFRLSKIRTSESIFETKMGLVHSPGGNSYYGGVWANDQVEYAGPFFPFLGYSPAVEASINAYRKFASVMKDDYQRIPSSFEMEGTLTCCSKDRGDAAMYAYGASVFLLYLGDKNVAEELWPSITWSLEYNRRRKTPEGVIASESDEMEGRIPTGKANLSTSSLAYGGLKYAAALARSLNKPSTLVEQLEKEAGELAQSIENHFGANVEGYETYQYFDGHDKLRHWICLPLVMGIEDRKEGTINALFSGLWTENGLAVTSGSDVFWDRGTLYALRGAFKVGASDKAHHFLKDYSEKRLLGEHVPYPVEAFPEGGQAHLAAESALYCRIFTEGLLGIEPTGFSSFICKPALPSEWLEVKLDNIQAFGGNFSLTVKRIDNAMQVEIIKDNKVVISKLQPEGEAFDIVLPQ